MNLKPLIRQLVREELNRRSLNKKTLNEVGDREIKPPSFEISNEHGTDPGAGSGIIEFRVKNILYKIRYAYQQRRDDTIFLEITISAFERNTDTNLMRTNQDKAFKIMAYYKYCFKEIIDIAGSEADITLIKLRNTSSGSLKLGSPSINSPDRNFIKNAMLSAMKDKGYPASILEVGIY